MFLATPWWVNLLVLVPVVTYLVYRSWGLAVDRVALVAGLTFGLAFGFVEAVVVVYLRAATGLLSASQVMTITGPGSAQQATSQVLAAMPASLVSIERLREAATIVMLVSVAMLGAQTAWRASPYSSGPSPPGTLPTTRASG